MNIKEYRLKNRLSQQETARLLNINQTTYSHYETERNEPNIETLKKMADIFKITIDELVGRPTDTINLKFMDETRKNLIKELLEASDTQINLINAYWQGMKLAEKERQAIINRFNKNGVK